MQFIPPLSSENPEKENAKTMEYVSTSTILDQVPKSAPEIMPPQKKFDNLTPRWQKLNSKNGGKSQCQLLFPMRPFHRNQVTIL